MTVEVLPSPRERLAACEHVIERGMASFIEVGNALAEIRDSRLYLEKNATFEEYCRDRWNLSRKRAYDQIAAASVSHMCDIENERQALALVPLKDDPDLLREVWQAVIDSGERPTAALVRKAINPPEDKEDTFTDDTWKHVLDMLDELREVKRVAASVPERRKAATAKRYRDIATHLAQIAWELENAHLDKELNR